MKKWISILFILGLLFSCSWEKNKFETNTIKQEKTINEVLEVKEWVDVITDIFTINWEEIKRPRLENQPDY